MAVLNPDHLFDQADRLVVPPPSGPPRQVDIRRAISNAYYGLFHFAMTSVADEIVSITQRMTPRYALVYRSVDHRTLKDICTDVQKPTMPPRYGPYAPPAGFGVDIQAFAAATVGLQDKRHRADYNPQPRFTTSDARVAVLTARSAVQRFLRADADLKKMFLTCLLCPPR